jgi:hypothetical protein
VKQYPKASDYANMLQHPTKAFTVPDLQQAVVATDVMGLPWPVPGSSAVVFKAAIKRQDYALRCYTRDEASSPDRYAALSRYVEGKRALNGSVGTVKWHDRAIRANGGTWPVLQMEWIDGDVLGEYVGYLADSGEKQTLGSLAGQWRDLVRGLQAEEFAHGDLQHRNVIIDGQQRLRLVDFDGVWCPPLQGRPPPTERGHDNFQPPGRTSGGRWGPTMDTFSALVIYLALIALSRETALWAPLNDGENLLFTSKDFSPPFNTKVWDLLARLSDQNVDRLAAKLRDACVPAGAGDKTLEAVLTPGWWEQKNAVPAPRPPSTQSRPRTSSGVTGPAPWYTQPVPVRPSGGYQSPVARPAPVPAKPSAPTGGGKWWETTANASGSGPTRRAASGQSSATRPSPTRPAAGLGQQAAVAQTMPQRNVAAKPNYPHRPAGLLLFLAGIVVFAVLAGSHSAWEWAGAAIVLLGLGLFWDKR